MSKFMPIEIPEVKGTLVKVELIDENKSSIALCPYYLRCEYLVEDEKGLHKIIYPRVRVPFPKDYTPAVSYIDGYTATINGFNGVAMELLSEKIEQCSEASFYVKQILRRKMTMAEIEEALGYAVEIVEEK